MPQVIWILGESYLATEQTEEAKAEFQILIEKYPYTWASWGYLGSGMSILLPGVRKCHNFLSESAGKSPRL